MWQRGERVAAPVPRECAPQRGVKWRDTTRHHDERDRQALGNVVDRDGDVDEEPEYFTASKAAATSGTQHTRAHAEEGERGRRLDEPHAHTDALGQRVQRHDAHDQQHLARIQALELAES